MSSVSGAVRCAHISVSGAGAVRVRCAHVSVRARHSCKYVRPTLTVLRQFLYPPVYCREFPQLRNRSTIRLLFSFYSATRHASSTAYTGTRVQPILYNVDLLLAVNSGVLRKTPGWLHNPKCVRSVRIIIREARRGETHHVKNESNFILC